ncbi:MAG: hypothetical protein ACHQF3_16330 [Alphaproteobacteria bacterium]
MATAERLRIAARRLRRLSDDSTDPEQLSPTVAERLGTSAARFEAYADALEGEPADDAAHHPVDAAA